MVGSRLRQAEICRGREVEFGIASAAGAASGGIRTASNASVVGNLSPDVVDSNLVHWHRGVLLSRRKGFALAMDGESDDRAALLHRSFRREAREISRYRAVQVGLLYGPFV